MSENFLDYRVVSVIPSQCSSYCVQEKKTGRFFVWDAIDYGLLSDEAKSVVVDEIKKLMGVHHQHVVQCINYVDHTTSGTLYLVKEYCGGSVAALIKKCQSTKSYVDESFIWNILYQTARAAQALYSRGPQSISLDITVQGVHLNDDGNVKLDYWLLCRPSATEKRRVDGSSKDGSQHSQRGHKKTDCHALGCMIHALATLNNSSTSANPKLPAHYSEDLKTILDLMLTPDEEKRPNIEAVIYHPSIMSHVVSSSMQHLSLRESTSQRSQEDRMNPIDKVCSRCKELDGKQSAVRGREANIRAREADLREKERTMAQRSKHIAIMEQLAKEKLDKAQVCLNQALRKQSAGFKSGPPDELDSSSYSADPGDMYLVPTAAKLDPTRILRPLSLAPSVCSRLSRSVRFDTIPELDEPQRAANTQMKWLENKRNLYKAARVKHKLAHKTVARIDKENQDPRTEKVNISLVSLPHSTKETQSGLLETFFR